MVLKSKEFFKWMVLFRQTIAHCITGGLRPILSKTCRNHFIWLIFWFLWNENYYSCNKNPVYGGKEYYYVWSRSLMSITVRQVNDAMGEVYSWRTRQRWAVVNNVYSTTTAISTAAPRPKKWLAIVIPKICKEFYLIISSQTTILTPTDRLFVHII
jgi:hypothetical protein